MKSPRCLRIAFFTCAASSARRACRQLALCSVFASWSRPSRRPPCRSLRRILESLARGLTGLELAVERRCGCRPLGRGDLGERAAGRVQVRRLLGLARDVGTARRAAGCRRRAAAPGCTVGSPAGARALVRGRTACWRREAALAARAPRSRAGLLRTALAAVAGQVRVGIGALANGTQHVVLCRRRARAPVRARDRLAC